MRRAICSAFSLLLVPGAALAAPGIPEAFYGSTNGSGEVDALIGGVVVASTTASGGRYGYAPHLLIVPDPGGTRSGTQVSFTVGGVEVGQGTTFTNGAIVRFDLTLPETSSASVGAAPTISSVSGGPIATSSFHFPKLVIPTNFDLTGDRRFDLADLTALLGMWGIAPFSPADFNRDGVVDLYDFNQLLFKTHL